MIGHIGGVPIEEFLLPFLVSTGTVLLAAAKGMFSRTATRGRRGRETECARAARERSSR
jgi:hypothetical protein